MAERQAEPVQRVEAYCVVPPGQPVPGHVAVGHVISVQPNSHPIVPSFGMPHAEVKVAALKSEWPFPMPCSCCMPNVCSKDQGLCCYACCCTVCAHAEIAEMNDIEGLFKQKEWWKQTAVVCSLWCCIYTVGEVALGLGLCFAPCLCTAYYTQIRDGVKHKYGLPNDEFCGSYTYTTYLPYICGSCCCCLPICPNCNSCAAYQMAYFMKYNAPVKKEFKSPCYTLLCSICSPKA